MVETAGSPRQHMFLTMRYGIDNTDKLCISDTLMIHMGFSSDDIHYINHKSFSDMVITSKGMLGTGFADAP